ncbi:MAG: GIY-YIG nuclease family protein [Archangium sp.]|nr:GIY-YIG nuclease family protein [Archangium sp.]
MAESDQVAFYFLFGESEEGDPMVYIGQTGDLRARLAWHNLKKDFWQRACVVISRTNSLTQTHALFLEWHCIQVARKIGRYVDDNNNAGSRPHTPAPLEADCVEIFETTSALLSTLGFPVFDPVGELGSSINADDRFFCTVTGIDGRGLYAPDGFVVLKGSRGRRANVPTFTASNTAFRKRLVESGVMKEEGDEVVFTRDHLFTTPSMAAMALLGRTSNGWMEWKNKDGETLHDIKRKPLEEKE